ncbi:unnamed protein product [Thlaspi arvense]|uniref:X8 domain-containing protein n=1 Tax=Thlaspi arvense TaxID=13288 RepID=A0AAU9RNS1_THLAR|nr:unnamed protein product [Thlaspi arvense]
MSSQILTILLILSVVAIHNLPVVTCKQWCVALPSSSAEQLQANINFGCTQINCGPIQPDGSCFYPITLLDHASYVMNAYYQSRGRTDDACGFQGSGYVIYSDPSAGSCVY